MSAILTQRQEEHAERLRADPYFVDNDISVITENSKDIQNRIDVAVAKLGICVVVVTPSASTPIGQFQPFFKDVKIVGRVLENVVINRSKTSYQTALEVAEHVAALWHAFLTDSDQNSTTLDEPSIALGFDPVCLCYDVSAKTSGGMLYDIPQLDAPSIDIAAGTVTLTGSTPGEALFYSTDGKRPTPRNGTLYTAPFAVGSGLTVKAQSYLAGYNPSDVAEATS